MDPEISSWVIEWLLRNNAPETLVKLSMGSLPMSACGSRVEKLILLRTILGEVSQGLVFETILDKLETIEHLNCIEGISVTEMMREAYCAVALECTLKFIAASPHDNPEYIKAVNRIWRGRIPQIEAKSSMLFSKELKYWKNDIEVSLCDPEMRQRFADIPSRRNALKKVRACMEEAWKEMGPSFLETVKAGKATNGLVSKAEPVNKNEGRSDRQELNKCVSPMHEETVNKDEQRPDCKELGKVGTPTQKETVNKDEQRPDCKELGKVGTPTQKETVNKDEQRPDCKELGKVGTPTQKETVNKDEQRPDCKELGKVGTPTQKETGSGLLGTSRFHLPSPKRYKISPLKKYEDIKITRRRIVKKWSVLEEDTLRAAVHKFGEGDWKLILNSHEDVFEHRTAVDLKDKWRNMKRYG